MSLKIENVDDLIALRESEEIEAKLAKGRDGTGEIPKDFWETYSAFANTKGGYVVLGAKEEPDGSFSLPSETINFSKLKTDLFNQLNNKQKVSVNLIQTDDVYEVSLDHRSVLVIRVPQASRQHRPVYINGNPMVGTYKRLHDGDRLCDVESVKRLLAEQTEDSRDSRVLRGFGIEDLNSESIDVFRRLLSVAKPSHPFLEKDRLDFLRAIGALKRDRETGIEGVTVAGLLMLGTSETIRDEFPNYALDYQERDEAKAENRWIDRVTTDGTWSGNLLDFYRLVWRRLTASLKAPFQLVGGQRQDETPIHVALREALVNCLVHADYSGRSSILIVKRPDMFGFKNPGLMRVPLESAIKGGESDGRNRTLQQMFLLIGAGERAGSGVPKIHQGWRDQHWRPPALYEKTIPSEQTLLELRMEDLLPPEIVDELRETFGLAFDQLLPEERIILVTAALETTVSHSRVMSLCDLHATDLTRMLQNLVHNGFLSKSGQGRGTKYHLPGVNLPDPDVAFAGSPSLPGSNSGTFGIKPSEFSPKPSELDFQPSDLANDNSDANVVKTRKGLVIDGLAHPIIHDLSEIDTEIVGELEHIAGDLGGAGKVPQDRMRDVIQRLCANRYLTLKVLAQLLKREENYLRQSHLSPMAEAGTLGRAFPQKPNDPRQAYIGQDRTPPFTPDGTPLDD
jgi:predicted HTH transcriptional regulator